MNKPDDIPRDVWGKALEAMPPVVRKGISESPVTMALRLGIARAIMAARLQEREMVQDLSDCLEDMTNHYVELINSGDAGNWNPEDEIEVQAARKMISAIRNRKP